MLARQRLSEPLALKQAAREGSPVWRIAAKAWHRQWIGGGPVAEHVAHAWQLPELGGLQEKGNHTHICVAQPWGDALLSATTCKLSSGATLNVCCVCGNGRGGTRTCTRQKALPYHPHPWCRLHEELWHATDTSRGRAAMQSRCLHAHCLYVPVCASPVCACASPVCACASPVCASPVCACMRIACKCLAEPLSHAPLSCAEPSSA